MQEPAAVTQTDESPNFVSGLYWRDKSKRQVYTPKPVVLSLQDGQLTMTGADAEIFRVPVNTVAVTFTSSMTLEMRLTVNGRLYILIAIAGPASAKFSPTQLALLNGAADKSRMVNHGLAESIAGSAIHNVTNAAPIQAAGVGLEAVGLVSSGAGIYSAQKLLQKWQAVLARNGVAVTMRKYHGVAYGLLGALGMFLVLLLILSLLFGQQK